MDFSITLGRYRLAMVDSVTITRSVENLADTARIKLPAAAYNQALNIEDKIKRGDKVVIKLGYDAQLSELPIEFEGYIEEISVDNDSIEIVCMDELFNFCKDLTDIVLPNVTVEELLLHVISEMGEFALSCDYDFKYDKFTIYGATGFDVLKKVQEETKANIYLEGKTLHVHPQYIQIGNRVVYDFAKNIEKSSLKYKDASNKKLLVTVEGTDANGQVVKVSKGTPGGDKFTLKLPGVSDKSALERRAEEEMNLKAYEGYEGDITGWLIPACSPTDVAIIRDKDYEYKNGGYYVVSVETTFSSSGGSRKVTIGKKIE